MSSQATTKLVTQAALLGRIANAPTRRLIATSSCRSAWALEGNNDRFGNHYQSNFTFNRSMTTNGYNHDGPQGIHITPQDPSTIDERKNKSENPPPSNTDKGSATKDTRFEKIKDPYPNNGIRKYSTTTVMTADMDKQKKDEDTLSASMPAVDVQDETDIEEVAKMQGTEAAEILKEEGRDSRVFSSGESDPSNPTNQVGRPTTNSPNPVVSLREDPDEALKEGVKEASTQAKEQAHAAKEYLTEQGQHAKETMKDGKETFKEKSHEASEYFSEKKDEAQMKAHEASEYFSEKKDEAQVKAHEASEFLSEKKDTAQEKAHEASEYLSEKKDEAQVKAQETSEFLSEKKDKATEQLKNTQEYVSEKAQVAQEKAQPMMDRASEAFHAVKDKVQEMVGNTSTSNSTSDRDVTSNKPNTDRMDAVNHAREGRDTSNLYDIPEREFEHGENNGGESMERAKDKRKYA